MDKSKDKDVSPEEQLEAERKRIQTEAPKNVRAHSKKGTRLLKAAALVRLHSIDYRFSFL
jgi:hypothetical protein